MSERLRLLPQSGSGPWYFRAVKQCTRRNVKGSWRLLAHLSKSGYLDAPVFYRLSDEVGIEVPISRVSNCWDQQDIDEYEQDLLQNLFAAERDLRAPVTLIDAGADIGIFSLKVAGSCPSVRRIIAFEPNREAYPWLQRNLERLPYYTLAIAKAAADFAGNGELRFPANDPHSDHARYLEPSQNGPIEVITIDSVPSSEDPFDLILKLDVEGGELAALRGAIGTIRRARNAVVVMEAHPSVVKRIGIDPVESLRLLAATRRFSFVIGETGQPVELGHPLFTQVPSDRVLNLICRTAA